MMSRIILIASFESTSKAADVRNTLESIFDDLSEQVSALYKRQDGVGDIADIRKIYNKHGLRNDTGWEPDLPVLINGNELAWALPAGAYAEDIHNLLLNLGASEITAHHQPDDMEEWRLAPHPMVMSLLDEDADEDMPAPMITRKRTIH